MVELRPVATNADVEAYLDVRNRVEPEDPVSAASFRAWRSRPDRIDLLALRDGAAVGMGFVGRNISDPESAYAYGKVGVLREARRQGVGTRLYRALSEHARSFGRTGMATEVREDEHDALGYLGKRGYTTVLRAQEVAVDVAASDVAVAPPVGVELVPLLDEALDRELYEAAVEIEHDLPAVEAVVTPPFEHWHASALGADVLRGCSFAARAGGVIVGVGFVCERPWGGVHGLTGVRRAWRGRGIARAIKSAQIAAAKAAGMRELRGSNEVANAPIRRLNESLGYRPLVAWLELRGPLILG